MSTSFARRTGLSALLLLVVIGSAAPAFAQQQEPTETVADPEAGSAEVAEPDETPDEDEEAAESEKAESGLRLESSLGIRALPIGISLFTDGGYRFGLFDSSSDLLKNTYVDAGIATGLSPAYVFAGGYVEALPVQVLALRFVAQYLNYFGTFGYLYTPEDTANPSWEIDDFDESADNDAGVATTGLLLQAQATPRVKVGNLVITAETTWTQLDMDVDQVYYEPFFDLLLDPKDSFLITRPTIGWVFTMDQLDSWILAGFRWEHTHVYGRDYNRELAALLGLWKVPPSWISWGEPKVALVGGWWVDHPNRENTPWIGGQISMEFGATGSVGDDE